MARKHRSTPSAVPQRFGDVAAFIRTRLAEDEVLRELREEHRLANATLARLRRTRPRPAERIAEYSVMLAELESEIIQYLLNTKRPDLPD